MMLTKRDRSDLVDIKPRAINAQSFLNQTLGAWLRPYRDLLSLHTKSGLRLSTNLVC